MLKQSIHTYILTNAIVNFNSHNLYNIIFSAPFLFNSWILAIGHGVDMRCHPFDGHNASDDATIYNVMNISLSHTSPSFPTDNGAYS